MAPLEKSRDYKDDANGRKMWAHAQPISPSVKTEDELDVATRNGHTAEIVDSPTLPLPTTGIDKLPAQVNFKSINQPSASSYSFIDGLPVEQQETWIFPTVQDTRKITAKLGSRVSSAQVYVSHIRDLVKNSGIYALSSIASPLISLVLAPFLTHHLSRPDYGALAILNTLIALAAGITQLGLSPAFFRVYCFEYESESDKSKVLSTLVILLILISIPTTIVAIMAAPWLATLLLNSASYGDSVRLAALIVLLQNLTVPGFAWLRSANHAAFSSTLSIASLLVTLAANLILVGGLHMGLAGSLIATGSGYALVAICSLPIILLRAGLHLRFDMAWSLLTFGVPCVTNLASNWVLQLSDRYLLGRLGSLSQTASYAVAYSLGGVLSAVIVTPFSFAWAPSLYAVAKRDDAAHIFRLIFRWFSLVLLFAAFGLSLVGIILLDLFFPPAYHSTVPVIPIVAVSTMFNGIFVVVSVGIALQRKPWFTFIITTLSALVNVGFNIILIPYYGAMGAAVSTLIAYVLLAVVGYGVNQRIYPVPFEIGLFTIALSIGVVLYTGDMFLVRTQKTYIGWAISLCALVLYGVCLAFLGKLPTQRRKHKSQKAQEGFVT